MALATTTQNSLTVVCRSFLMLVVTLTTACGSDDGAVPSKASLDRRAVPLARCYEFQTQPMRYAYSDAELQGVANRHRDIREDAACVRPPRRVLLDAPSPGNVLVLPDTADHCPLMRRFHWERLASDTVRIKWADGFIGVALELAVQDDSVHGVARSFSDEGSLDAEGALVGWRIDCLTFRRVKRSSDRNRR